MDFSGILDPDEYEGKPWSRQSYDTRKSFEAFCIYCDMPADERSLRKLAEETGRSGTAWLENWSSEHNWQERVAAYDAYRKKKARERREEEYEEQLSDFMEREMMLQEASLEAAVRLLDQINAKLEEFEDEDESMLEAEDVPNALKAACKASDTSSEAQAKILGVHRLLQLMQADEIE